MAGIRILVVEDESIVAMDIAATLRNLGYEVTATVPSGEQAVREVEENMPDLVLMDIVLKGEMDGIVAAERIRSLFNVPIVFLTAYADKKTLERAKITGPFGYIMKPFEETDLRVALEIALYKANMEAEREQLIAKLQDALDTIKTLSGLIPICASCKKIRDDKGYWQAVEQYIEQHSDAEFTHGICPECLRKLYPEYADDILVEEKNGNGSVN